MSCGRFSVLGSPPSGELSRRLTTPSCCETAPHYISHAVHRSRPAIYDQVEHHVVRELASLAAVEALREPVHAQAAGVKSPKLLSLDCAVGEDTLADILPAVDNGEAETISATWCEVLLQRWSVTSTRPSHFTF